MHSVLVAGKRGGILHWFENLLDAAEFLPGVRIAGFALNHNTWQERLQKRIHKTVHLQSRSTALAARNLDRAIGLAKPDIILVTDLYYLADPILEVLQRARANAAIAHWIGDFFDSRLQAASHVIDTYYFTDSSFIDDAAQLGIANTRYLPLAANARLFHPPRKAARNNRLIFIGAHSQNRQDMIDAIATPKTVIGKGWRAHPGRQDEYLDRSIDLASVAAHYRASSVVLNVLNRNNVRHGLNMRCFEATACGALLLTEESPDNSRCFVPGEEIITYNSPADADRLLHELSADRSRLETIALRGQQRTSSAHLYQHRLQTIIDGS